MRWCMLPCCFVSMIACRQHFSPTRMHRIEFKPIFDFDYLNPTRVSLMLSYLSTWVELWCARLEVRSGIGYVHQHWQELEALENPLVVLQLTHTINNKMELMTWSNMLWAHDCPKWWNYSKELLCCGSISPLRKIDPWLYRHISPHAFSSNGKFRRYWTIDFRRYCQTDTREWK